MAGITNRGKWLILNYYFRRQGSLPGSFYIALCRETVAPNEDTNTMSELVEITAGNGYTSGGQQIQANTTGFDGGGEDDTYNKAYVKRTDTQFLATIGYLPSDQVGARYAVLTDDNATLGDRQIIAWWDLGANRVVSPSQSLLLEDCILQLEE